MAMSMTIALNVRIQILPHEVNHYFLNISLRFKYAIKELKVLKNNFLHIPGMHFAIKIESLKENENNL